MKKKISINLASVIVVNFNNSKFINQCILSLKKQNFKKIEIIFVDNQSSDNSLQKISLYRNVKIIKNKRKFLFGSFNQMDSYYQGFLKSKGEIIFFLDSDDFFKKLKISKVIKQFEKNIDHQILFDFPIYLNGKKKNYYKFKQKKLILSNWPRFSPQSCISIRRNFAKEVFNKLRIRKFPDICDQSSIQDLQSHFDNTLDKAENESMFKAINTQCQQCVENEKAMSNMENKLSQAIIQIQR